MDYSIFLSLIISILLTFFLIKYSELFKNLIEDSIQGALNY